MITCPKCASASVLTAPDEAPAWAKLWMKCFACGKRWDQAGSAPCEEEHEAEDDETESPVLKRSGEDLVALVMKVARGAPAVESKETTMARCTRASCLNDAAADSVQCPKHRDMQRRANAKFQGRMLPAAGSLQRKITRRIPLVGGAASMAVAPMPATRTAPITLAEPTIVNGSPRRRMDLNGNVLTVMESVLATLRADVEALERAREILERHGQNPG